MFSKLSIYFLHVEKLQFFILKQMNDEGGGLDRGKEREMGVVGGEEAEIINK